MRNTVVAIMLFLVPLGVYADQEYHEGEHYEKVVPEQPGADGNKIQVMEFFMYSCGHCYQFEPTLQEWLQHKPEDVEFVKVPAVFDRPQVVMYAKTFYALQQLGVDQNIITSKIFHTLHAVGKRLRTQEEMEEFLAGSGIDVDEYRKAMESFAILTNVRKASVLAEDFGISGVPALVVDGKYVIPGQKAETMIGALKQLIEEVRNSKAVEAENAKP